MTAEFFPSRAKGTLPAPPSKSAAHRLLICAGLARGESRVEGIGESEDIAATVDCLRTLGAEINLQKGVAVVRGIDPLTAEPKGNLLCRESGSTLRFLIPLALASGKSTVLCGSKKLLTRPLNVYETICREKGMYFLQDECSVTVQGPLKSGEYRIAGNISSQFVSGLLFALPLLQGNSTVRILPPVESGSYIALTLRALEQFGIAAKQPEANTLVIAGGQHYTPAKVTVEGDYSNAAFSEALNLFGGDVTVTGLDPASLQGDKIYKKHFESLCRGTPVIHMANCPDLAPLLFAVAAAKHGGVFTGTARLKIKESDRAAVMAQELQKFGTAVTVHEDSVVIFPKEFHAPAEILNGHNDHRIVMALSVLCTLTGGKIEGAQAVGKSYPAFFRNLRDLGVEVNLCEDNA